VTVEQHDLQGNVLCGYGFPLASFAFVRVREASAGRRLLAELRPRLTDATSWGSSPPPCAINLSIGWQGLRALGLPDAMLEHFPEELRAGMAERADLLGDADDAAPGHWQEELEPGRVQLVVTLSGRDAAGLEQARATLRDALEQAGPDVGLEHEEPTAVIAAPGEPLAREHFGFADGFAQPAIDDPRAGPYNKPGQGTPRGERRWKPIAPGEFVLGYRDEDGILPGAELGPLGRNATFTVLRKLEQDVAGFRAFLDEHADERGPEWLASRLMGRWRDGTPVEASPEAPHPSWACEPRGRRLNNFRYGGDPDGHRCPLGAHVRRANPRDGLGWGGTLTRRHRIIRRGMPYGSPLPDGATDDRADRGLMFVCHQASIARQFEVIQGLWLADGDALGLGDDTDPIVAGPRPTPAPGKFTIQGREPRFVGPLRRFVTMRGGEYLFTPGLAAVQALAGGAARA
jgi:Dyp-type peroxidase family